MRNRIHIDVLALAVVQRRHEERCVSYLTDVAAAVRLTLGVDQPTANYIAADSIAKWAHGYGNVRPATRAAAKAAVWDALSRQGHQPADAPTVSPPTRSMPPLVSFVEAFNSSHRQRRHDQALGRPLPVRLFVQPSVNTPEMRKHP
jgi:hypothetical protein